MELIGKIYEALDDDQALEALPGLIANEIGSRSCTLQIFGADSSLEGMWLNYFGHEMDEFYRINDLHFQDTWAQTMRVSGLNKANRHSDFISTDEFCKSFFYNEFIRRFGDDSAYCLGCGSTREDGGLVVLGLHKARSDKDFTKEQVGKLEAIRPHLTRMADLRRNLQLLEGIGSSALIGIDSIEDGYLLVRTNGKIAFANTAAEALLSEGRLMQSSAGSLSLVRQKDHKRLARALKDASENRAKGRVCFRARDTADGDWRFTLAPKAVGEETVILVWVGRSQIGKSAPAALGQIYGLTKAEIPILMAVSEGLSAAEVSHRLSLSIATIRSHLQHIYQKTGVHKATQLATLVATLPKI